MINLFGILAAACLPASGPDRPPIVSGFDRFHAAGDAEGGRLLIGDLGCAACHRGGGEELHSKRAPILTDVGSRVKPDWFRKWVREPHALKPGTTMPRVADVSADAAEALTHYLMTLRADKPFSRISGRADDGKKLYNTVGCKACHGDGDPAGVPLGDLKAKYQGPAPLAQFLRDPLRWRPSGRMPSMHLNEREAMAVASGMVGLSHGSRDPDDPGETLPGLVYEYFEGSWNKLPDFDALKPVATGTTTKIGFQLKKRPNQMGFRFFGYVAIERDGIYTFSTNSDDGSALYVGDLRIVDNDGVHGGTEAFGSIFLKKGKHALRVECFEQGGGEHCHVKFEGPGLSKREIPASAMSHHPSKKYVTRPTPPAGGFKPDPALATRGRTLFASLRCVACHEVPDRPKAPDAPAFASLKRAPNKGCLAPKPVTSAPWYGLSDAQRKAIRAALSAGGADTPESRITATMTRFNCYACHERRGRGGPDAERSKFFTSSQPAVGDEGRIPPRLDDVGAKLAPGWLREVLEKGTKVRPYVKTRMPVFGPKNVASLVEDFPKTESLVDAPGAPRDRGTIKTGRILAGNKGLACVTCHAWNGQTTPGIQAMDLVKMPQRLRRDWFNRYMVDPAGLRPGTRMPTYWPDGKGVQKAILDGDPKLQLEALWQYLAEGGKASKPRGVGSNEILLEPTTGAIIYRNFIQGAGPRAIAVGYPEGAHLAFDANEMRLALIWHGDFIDASKHWVGRGQGFQPPAGDNVVKLHAGPPFAILADANAEWPKEGKARFIEYDLDSQRRPTFLYEVAGARVRDFFEAVETKKDPIFRRTLTFEAKTPPRGLWYRAAINGTPPSRIDLADGVKAVSRKSGGKTELLVPVRFRGNMAQIIQVLEW